EVTRTLERELSERFTALSEKGAVRFRIEPHLGNMGEHLSELAEKENCDLLVVGSHERKGLVRLWEGSVSRAALKRASMSVACVPQPVTGAMGYKPAKIASVLAATDFSNTGNAALAFAYSLVGS